MTTRLLAVLLSLAPACVAAPEVRGDACATEVASEKYCSDRCASKEECIASGRCDEVRALREHRDDGPVASGAGSPAAEEERVERAGAVPTNPGVPCRGDRGDVGFGPNSADVAPCAEVVRAMAETLLSRGPRDSVFEVVGGWDVNETADLGRARARAVRRALVEAGVPGGRLLEGEPIRGEPSVRLVLAPAARME